jgi:hypothetical protein
MKRRAVQVIGVVVTTIVVALAMATASGQTTTSTAKAATIKTSWGDPDFQGIWTINYQIPLQRPAKYKDKAFFTDAEIAELDKERAGKPGHGEKRAERGTEADVAGAYDSQVFQTRRHTGRRTSLIVDPADGRIPPLTPAAQQKNQEIREFQLSLLEDTEACKNHMRECQGGKYTGKPSPRRFDAYKYYPNQNIGSANRADGPEDHGLGMRCMAAILPELGGATVGGFWQLAQAPGAVSIFYDTGQGQGWHRTLQLDGSSHLPSSIRLWWGDSRAHWEGDTLVIDVTNFSGKTNFRGSTDNLHLVERWRRTSPETLEYRVTIEDPTTWTKPWTVVEEYAKQSDKFNRIYKEPRCVEGNYSIFGWLAGAREKERLFAEGKGSDPATINYVTDTSSSLDAEDLDDLVN